MRFESIVKGLNHLLLEGWSQINQHIAATHQIQLRKGGIFCHVVQSKKTLLTDCLTNTIMLPVAIKGRKEPLEALGRNSTERTGGVDACSGTSEHLGIDIGGKD